MHPLITPAHVEAYRRDGAVLIRGLLADHVGTLRAGIARNMAEPGPVGLREPATRGGGPLLRRLLQLDPHPRVRGRHPSLPSGPVAGDLMGAQEVQVFHDHILVKEPGTSKATPWHQDGPYYFVEGPQTVSFWSPLDPVREASLRCVAGSHLWPKPVLPKRWLAGADFFPDEGQYMPVPDPDAEGMTVLEWEMEPGDAVAFDFRTLHGARGNEAATRRRAFSLRLVGEEARVVDRPGPTSPPFTGHGMQAGERLREDWFPVIWRREAG
jgi:hypothetical protein